MPLKYPITPSSGLSLPVVPVLSLATSVPTTQTIIAPSASRPPIKHFPSFYTSAFSTGVNFSKYKLIRMSRQLICKHMFHFKPPTRTQSLHLLWSSSPFPKLYVLAFYVKDRKPSKTVLKVLETTSKHAHKIICGAAIHTSFSRFSFYL